MDKVIAIVCYLDEDGDACREELKTAEEIEAVRTGEPPWDERPSFLVQWTPAGLVVEDFT